MAEEASAHARRLFVPAVVQTSDLDCGPASLKALLAGFDIQVSYGRLREACQTDIDGTSIDVIESLAVRLGLDAAQYIVPADHLLMDEADALPCLVVTSQPNGLTHFVIIWRTHGYGHLVQGMDPGTGRMWKTRRRFLRDVLIHRFPASAELAYQWLTAPAFLDPLRRRLADLGCSAATIEETLERAQTGDEWLPVAALDAVTRLTARLVRSGAIERGVAAERFIQRLSVEAARGNAEDALAMVPPNDWSVGELANGDVELRGAVIVHVAGRSEPAAPEGTEDELPDAPAPNDLVGSPEIAAAIEGDGASPVRSIVAAAFAEFGAALPVLLLALLLAGAAVVIEALLFSGLIGAVRASPGAVVVVFVFLLVSFLLNLSVSAVLLRLGRWLDIHLRIRMLEKLPRLGNYYFHSRLTSDLAHRAHELRGLRLLPQAAANGLRVVSEIVVTTAGIAWLFPQGAAPVLLAALVILGLPLALLPLLREQDLRRTTHLGTLTRFYLDSLLGLTPIQAHCAEEPVRAEHEALLAKWASATREFYWTRTGGLGLGMVAGTLFALWTIGRYIDQGGSGGATLLIVFWSLKLPALSEEVVHVVQQWPGLHNRLLRLFDVLGASEEATIDELAAAAPVPTAPADAAAARVGVHVVMRGVAVVASGHRILAEVGLELRPGEHVAIVGPSGSGKSSLVGLLLGWHRAAEGSITIDGAPMQAEQLQRLRRETAWIDPAVQIWNRAFAHNLRYGNAEVSDAALHAAVRRADLTEVVERLPDGIDSSLGEGGGLVSGGEGQRVRLARAMLRPGVRLAILDEPFRGLDNDKRHELLAVARERWRGATMIYVSHDIDTTLDFTRVLVVEGGHIVEDDAPAVLLQRAGSRFAALREAQEAVDRDIWRNPVWRRWRMERGELRSLEEDT